jgi:hypothetical protein
LISPLAFIPVVVIAPHVNVFVPALIAPMANVWLVAVILPVAVMAPHVNEFVPALIKPDDVMPAALMFPEVVMAPHVNAFAAALIAPSTRRIPET